MSKISTALRAAALGPARPDMSEFLLTQELSIHQALWQHVRCKYGTQQVACQKLGINKATLSAALRGKRPIPPALLADAGYVARVVYERVPKENAQ